MKFQIIKITDNYFTAICPYHKENIPSLMIHRTGERAGQWKCWGCDRYGRLTNKEMQQLGCSKSKQIKRKTPEGWQKLQEFYQNANILIDSDILKQCANLWNINENCLRETNCGASCTTNDCYLIFPMRNENGQIIGIQKRFLDGAKRNLTGSKLGLFYNWPVVKQSQLIICEGLTDYLTLSDWGYWAVGAASATMNPKIILNFCLQFTPTQIILCSDNDKAGINFMYQIQMLCRKVTDSASLIIPPNPIKDIREWKEKGLTKIYFQNLIKI